MVFDGGIGTATAVGSAANVSLRLFQVIYEFKAVGQQTRDLLDSTKHVSSSLESAQTMRQQKSAFLSADERRWIDSIIIDTKRCLESVAALVEPARVDLQTKSGRVGFVTRSLFVFRDSPKVATNLARLNLAHQSLNAAMGVLCSKGTYWQPASELQAVNQLEAISPPSYEKDQFLQRGKLHRKGSVSTIRSYQQPPAFLLSDDGEKFPNTYSQYPKSIAELEDPDTKLPCTGVAYSTAPEWLTPTTLQHWPGKLGFETRNKVDTVLAYKPEGGRPVSWGFLVDYDRDDLILQELFKLWLDPAYRDELDGQQGDTIQEARTSFVDFMRCIYEAILVHFDETYPRWRTRRVEFLFSVPTTWETPITIANTERLIKEAGFGNEPGHLAKISLTEAEAAAVYVSKQSYQIGDIFLVCDAGGGTTDINALKVKDNRSFRTELEALRSVQGEAVGSTLIDFKVESIIAEKLERIAHVLSEHPDKIARTMMSDRFETFKCSFGMTTKDEVDLLLPIPGLSPGMNYPAAHVHNSMMTITR
ncbi:hypothetical protein QM012_007432 [Aureobasidium pullulans]|uniref:Actin-like ATPase domain-containing protein n=1 Tax=Aureobasidium pullulans TaxID=5580 RepID=A0ABR0TMX7_AURPU